MPLQPSLDGDGHGITPQLSTAASFVSEQLGELVGRSFSHTEVGFETVVPEASFSRTTSTTYPEDSGISVAVLPDPTHAASSSGLAGGNLNAASNTSAAMQEPARPAASDTSSWSSYPAATAGGGATEPADHEDGDTTASHLAADAGHAQVHFEDSGAHSEYAPKRGFRSTVSSNSRWSHAGTVGTSHAAGADNASEVEEDFLGAIHEHTEQEQAPDATDDIHVQQVGTEAVMKADLVQPICHPRPRLSRALKLCQSQVLKCLSHALQVLQDEQQQRNASQQPAEQGVTNAAEAPSQSHEPMQHFPAPSITTTEWLEEGELHSPGGIPSGFWGSPAKTYPTSSHPALHPAPVPTMNSILGFKEISSKISGDAAPAYQQPPQLQALEPAFTIAAALGGEELLAPSPELEAAYDAVGYDAARVSASGLGADTDFMIAAAPDVSPRPASGRLSRRSSRAIPVQALPASTDEGMMVDIPQPTSSRRTSRNSARQISLDGTPVGGAADLRRTVSNVGAGMLSRRMSRAASQRISADQDWVVPVAPGEGTLVSQPSRRMSRHPSQRVTADQDWVTADEQPAGLHVPAPASRRTSRTLSGEWGMGCCCQVLASNQCMHALHIPGYCEVHANLSY